MITTIDPTIKSKYVSERILQLLILSCQRKFEKEPNKIWDMFSVR